MPLRGWFDISGMLVFEVDEASRQKRRRSVAIALVLAGLAVLFFVMTLVRVHL